jgi:D-glycero-alpha-D-manno-heptose-7-phosphate kinase
LGGGSTDLKSFYDIYDGICISVAINKYVYVLINRPLQEEIVLKYSEQEKVKQIDEIKHPIIRESLKLFDFKTPQIEIVTCADMPSSSGLGGSSSFTCALLKALYSHRNIPILPDELARKACYIEIDRLQGNLGKQDQTISAYGGLQCMNFYRDETVDVIPLKMSYDKLLELQDNMLLFFTGFNKNTNNILKDQVEKTKSGDNEMIASLLKAKELGIESKKLLELGDIIGYGKLVHEHWINKRKRSLGMSNVLIDEWYDTAIHKGTAVGGKLVGAGGSGGFLMFIAENPKKLRTTMSEFKLEEVRFDFDFEGTKRIL